MMTVTSRYWWTRRHGIAGLLPHWLRHELARDGYLTLPRPWEISPTSRFSIARWLNPDGGTDAYSRHDEPMPRYSEVLDFPLNVWDAVRHPWNDERVVPIECFHTAKERRKYLNRKLDEAIDYVGKGKVMVMRLPYGGLPIVSVTSVEGKVTIL